MPARKAEARSEIAAPIDLVWSVMLDVAKYGEWNPFLVRIDAAGKTRVGTELRLEVKWVRGGGAKSKERITRLEPPSAGRATLEYVFLGPLAATGAVRASRLQTLEQAAGGPTVYHTYEEFGGWLAFALPLADVQAGFEAHARALKDRAERLASGG
jgi:hypothetical protein